MSDDLVRSASEYRSVGPGEGEGGRTAAVIKSTAPGIMGTEMRESDEHKNTCSKQSQRLPSYLTSKFYYPIGYPSSEEGFPRFSH